MAQISFRAEIVKRRGAWVLVKDLSSVHKFWIPYSHPDMRPGQQVEVTGEIRTLTSFPKVLPSMVAVIKV